MYQEINSSKSIFGSLCITFYVYIWAAVFSYIVKLNAVFIFFVSCSFHRHLGAAFGASFLVQLFTTVYIEQVESFHRKIAISSEIEWYLVYSLSDAEAFYEFFKRKLHQNNKYKV